MPIYNLRTKSISFFALFDVFGLSFLSGLFFRHPPGIKEAIEDRIVWIREVPVLATGETEECQAKNGCRKLSHIVHATSVPKGLKNYLTFRFKTLGACTKV
jgi:hypothetical protein